MKLFNPFKKKTEVEKLQDQYRRLLQESYDLSKTDRMASDLKQAEANELMNKIESLKKES